MKDEEGLGWESRGRGEKMLWFVSQSRSDSDSSSEMMDGVRGQERLRKSWEGRWRNV